MALNVFSVSNIICETFEPYLIQRVKVVFIIQFITSGYIHRKWSGRRDSNPQQPAWKAGTLAIELLPHKDGGLI